MYAIRIIAMTKTIVVSLSPIPIFLIIYFQLSKGVKMRLFIQQYEFVYDDKRNLSDCYSGIRINTSNPDNECPGG